VFYLSTSRYAFATSSCDAVDDCDDRRIDHDVDDGPDHDVAHLHHHRLADQALRTRDSPIVEAVAIR
jgi:hypothetical protein